MYKMISTFLLLAFFMSASAFTLNGAQDSAAAEKASSKIMLTITVAQVGPGTIGATWTSSSNGPFMVSLVDLTTGQRLQQFSTNNTFAVFSGLTVGHTYRVTVGDVNLIFADIKIA